MGKLPPLNESKSNQSHSKDCKNQDAPICGNKLCDNQRSREERYSYDNIRPVDQKNTEEIKDKVKEEPVQELLIVGAGPHALTLLLRLLEPDPDLLTEKKRHLNAESAKKSRPIREIHRHIKDIDQGPSATLKPIKTTGKSKKKNKSILVPPPLTLDLVLKRTKVVDASGSCWLASWKHNFDAIGISQLRSLMNAHCDPFDFRSLEYFAEAHGRGKELVTLRDLTQRDKLFRGPYQVPTTSLFHDFHDALVQSYGIKDVVQKGEVHSITPLKDGDSDENIFEVQICNCKGITITLRTRRCVFCMGPKFNNCENPWETDLREEEGENYDRVVSKRILRSDKIVQWLSDKKRTKDMEKKLRILIVGGGITSAQLGIRAVNASWCKRVVLIQRSQTLLRHFDVKNEWMGPKRGRILDDFYSLDMDDRADLLKSARKGGSLPPELFKEIQMLTKKNLNFICEEGVEISHVHWDSDNEEFHVSFDDDCSISSPVNVDYIWLATGCENVVKRYPVLEKLRQILPIDIVNGLPVLSPDLSWGGIIVKEEEHGCKSKNCSKKSLCAKKEPEECKWKQCARKRIFCMGALAGLQLGADALNIVGARHGAVKIANAVRSDMISN